jgi:hypothetical protein
MRPTRTITASLAAVLGAAALAGPAAAGQQGADDSAKANVYVPPAALYYPGAPADDSAKANVYVPPAALYPAATANNSAKAKVYVPPAGLRIAPANGSAKANVYVPPNPQPINQHVPAASASSSSFDWGSAGIGAATIVGAFLIALGGAAGLRRRRHTQPAATA